MMKTKRETSVKIAYNLLFPGKNYIYSPIVEQAICDILINNYGEDYKRLGRNLLANIRTFNKELACIQFALLDLIKRCQVDEYKNILYIGSDPRAAAFSILDTGSVLQNICPLTGWTPPTSSINLSYISTSKQDEGLGDSISYLIARLRASQGLKDFTIKDLGSQDLSKELPKEEVWDLIIVSNLSSFTDKDDSYPNLTAKLREGGALILLDLVRGAKKPFSRARTAGMTRDCSSYHLSIKGFNIKSRLVESLKAEDLTSGHKRDSNPIGEWMYTILLKDKTVSLTKGSNLGYLNKAANKKRLDIANTDETALRFLLKRFWGFNDYRQGQLKIITNALLDISSLGILPTGAGKSLCFQLPAIIRPGVSLVVSPLKSLMKDQVDHLKRKGFDYTAYLDSSMNKQTRSWTLRKLREGRIKLLYISPERLQIKSFQDELVGLLENQVINYFIIDEAHCASEWGHDFRPAYLKIQDIVKKLGSPTILALTATASNKVINDIVDIFGLDKSNLILPETFDRPEISFEVITSPIATSKDNLLRDVLTEKIPKLLGHNNLEDLHQEGSGIVFTVYADPRGKNTRMFGTEYIKDLLGGWGLCVGRYHSRLDGQIRTGIQDKYMGGEIPLLVSTKGFGMGIDKADIRYIIHMCFSNSLEAYYQEAGRCGRNKDHAHVILLATMRHPNCIKRTSYTGQVRCAKGWACSYTGGAKCDYGMQAKFICDEYGDDRLMKRKLNSLIDSLIMKAGGKKEFSISIDKDKFVSSQKYLFYLQRESVVKDYVIIKYLNKSIEVRVLLDKGFNHVSMRKVTKNIISRLQGFKRQKLNMLESIWNYVQNEEICRRRFLMNYFGENSRSDKACGFCDVDGIKVETAPNPGMRAKREILYGRLNEMLKQKDFDYEGIYKLVDETNKEGIDENIKIRSMRYLEDYPDNETALYISGIITLRRNSQEAYGYQQVFSCLSLLEGKDKTGDMTNILQELALIDQDIVKDLLDGLSDPFSEGGLIKSVYNSLTDIAIRDYIYLRYVDAQLSKINNMLEGAL